VAVIDATGDPAVLAELTAAVCERGVVVLAGEYLGRVPFDLYPDLHLRGLTAVGIPRPLADGLEPSDAESLSEATLATPDWPLPAALWYRLET
jgi:threonine dehydrogenase-like Zn-dependent dehydrogenase